MNRIAADEIEEATEVLARLPWTVRTTRCTISGEFLGWVLELPGTCAAAAREEELVAAIDRSIRSYLRVALFFKEPITLPAAAAMPWPIAGELLALEAAIDQPPRSN